MVLQVKSQYAHVLSLLMILFAVGCIDSVELVYIEGTVTLDSEPIPDAEVVFQPEDGRPSAGTTDADGHFVLQYIPGQPGAVPGTHRVMISTFVEADPDSPNPIVQEGRAEAVPECYNVNTTLTAELKSGQSSKLDFALHSASQALSAAQ